MNTHSIVSRITRLGIAAGLTFAIPLTGLAVERTSGATLTVTILPDRYFAADVTFVDLDALDALVAPANPSVLQLEACGPHAASALLAAAERYRGRYLELRVLAETERDCPAAMSEGAVRVSQAGGAVTARAAAVPTERYWQSVMP